MKTIDTVDMVTATGNFVWYDVPDYTIVDTEDIRIQTTHMCRYNGALDWKLVQHLALCAELARAYQEQTPMHRDKGLQIGYCAAHDFHEIYVTDVVHGLKAHLPDYQEIESIWEQYVHEQLGLPWGRRNQEFVSFIDRKALVCEMTLLNHPYAQQIQKKIAPMLPLEEEVFKRVQALSMQECWELAWRAVTETRVELMFEEKEENKDELHNRDTRTRHADQSMY